MKVRSVARIVAGVCAFWLLAGILWGAQGALGSSLQGRPPDSLMSVFRSGVMQMLPWIPVTLVAMVIAVRAPITRERWRGPLAIHLLAALGLAFVANVLVVLGFWMAAGRFRGLGVLAREGAKWALINFHVALLVYVAVVGVTMYVLDVRRRRAHELRLSRVEGQLARARLEALTSQIRPHFLFNTLHTIGQLWRSGRSDEADAMLDRLGALFHRVQSSTSRVEIPLEEELELVREYFAIEQARFRDRLTATIDVSPEAMAALVPPLILQPLVENAVRHGFSASSSAGTVRVSGRVSGGRLTVAVSDDGPGMSAASAQPGSGTGLRNVRERIAQLYGGGGSITVEEPADGGTVVRLDLPVGGSQLPDLATP